MVSYSELDLLEQECRKNLAALIRERRGKISVYRLARLSKVGEVTIHRVERGEGCNFASVVKLCRVLDLSILII